MTTTITCAHEYIEYDETQVDVDRFRTEATGTCEDCGRLVEWVEDGDDEGVHFYLTEVSVVPTTGDNRSEWQRQADEDWDYYNDDDTGA